MTNLLAVGLAGLVALLAMVVGIAASVGDVAITVAEDTQWTMLWVAIYLALAVPTVVVLVRKNRS